MGLMMARRRGIQKQKFAGKLKEVSKGVEKIAPKEERAPLEAKTDSQSPKGAKKKKKAVRSKRRGPI